MEVEVEEKKEDENKVDVLEREVKTVTSPRTCSMSVKASCMCPSCFKHIAFTNIAFACGSEVPADPYRALVFPSPPAEGVQVQTGL